LPEKASYQVILVSTTSEAMCRPACPRAMISEDQFPQEKLFVKIAKGFEQYPQDSFRFIQGTATQLDHIKRNVSVSLPDQTIETLDFYALVIATGASTPSPLFGFNGHDEVVLRSNWNSFRKALPEAKSIAIVGGGPTAIETAGELGEYLNGRAGWFSAKSGKPKVAITVITSGSKILPLLREAIASDAEKYLAQVGVTVIKNTHAETIEAHIGKDDIAGKTTLDLGNGKTLHADLYINATGMKFNTSFIKPELLTKDGRVETNENLRVEKAGPRVYAVGDVGSHARPAVHNSTYN
jgi:NADH dehydrogenase FAD-containing subunit